MRKRTKRRILTKNILTIDIGGSRVKVMTSRVRKKREFPSGSQLSAKAMVKKIKDLTKDWSYDVISLGYPGPVRRKPPDCRATQSRSRVGRLRFRKGGCISIRLIRSNHGGADFLLSLLNKSRNLVSKQRLLPRDLADFGIPSLSPSSLEC